MKLQTILFTALFFSLSSFLFAQEAAGFGGIRTVILDAGHGGRDPGNLGTKRYKTVERDITLMVTLKLGEYLRENLPDVKVVYTRRDNTSVDLEKRAEIANEAKGDLFVSIHCDSFRKSSVHGCTSIVLGRNHDDENRIALQENAAILLEDDYENRYEGFDLNNPESAIGLNLMQQTYLNESIAFASLVQKQFRERVQRKDRGVKQQPLYVTSRTAMPAVLIELGFLTNPAEEDFLNSDRGQSYMASAIFRAIRDFKQQQDLLVADAIKNQKVSGTGNEVNQEPAPKQDVPVQFKPEPKKETVAKEKEPVKENTNTVKKEEPKQKPRIKNKSANNPYVQFQQPKGIQFAVQILTLSSNKKASDSVFKGLKNLGRIEEAGLYKYYANPVTSYQEAQKSAQKLRQMGFKGAFVIGLENGKKISAVEARKKLP